MSCPYKWYFKRSLFIVLHAAISKNDFHVLEKKPIRQRSEYKACTSFIGTSVSEVFVI